MITERKYTLELSGHVFGVNFLLDVVLIVMLWYVGEYMVLQMIDAYPYYDHMVICKTFQLEDGFPGAGKFSSLGTLPLGSSIMRPASFDRVFYMKPYIVHLEMAPICCHRASSMRYLPRIQRDGVTPLLTSVPLCHDPHGISGQYLMEEALWQQMGAISKCTI